MDTPSLSEREKMEHAAATQLIGTYMAVMINSGIRGSIVAQALAEAGAIGLITSHFPHAAKTDQAKMLTWISDQLRPVVDHTLEALNSGALGPQFGANALN